MVRISRVATAIFIASCIPAQAQLSISTQACTAALAYLKQAQIQPLDRSIFFSGALDSSRTWTQSISLPIFSGDVTVPLTDDQVFLAYFLVRSVPDGGAVSAKISITAGPNDKPTNYVNLHRQAIKHADNRCLSRDLPRMDRVVRVNEYIDYHDPSKGGLSSDLEDFHFRYPVGSTSCAATNAPDVLSTFRFDNVSPTVGDSFLSRHFSLTTPAYAAGSNFSHLASELYYRRQVSGTGTCVGFLVPLKGSSQASLVIDELGFASQEGPVRRSWSIHR